jgi:hypothetical protein
VFRPRFTISILYLAGFALIFMFLMSLPGLIDVMSMGGDEETMTRRAAEVTRTHARPTVALLLSLLATGLGGYFEVLPGMREG